MTDQEIQEQIDSLRKTTKEITKTPETALQFLIEAGILPPGSKVIKKRKSKLKQ